MSLLTETRPAPSPSPGPVADALGQTALMRPALVALLVGTGVLHLWGSARPAGRTASTPRRRVEVAVLTVANLAVTVMRFVTMRAWMFVHRRR